MKTLFLLILALQCLLPCFSMGDEENKDQNDIILGLLTSGVEGDVFNASVSRITERINQDRMNLGRSRVVLIRETIKSLDAYALASKVCSLVSAEAIAILTKTSLQVNEQLRNLPIVAQTLTIPFIWEFCSHMDGGLCPNSTFVSIPRLAQTIASIVTSEDWNDVQLFYDETYGKQVNWLLDRLSMDQIQVSLFNIEDRNISAMLEVKSTFQSKDYFIVMATMQKAAWLFAQARITDLDILGPKYRWLITEDLSEDKTGILKLFKEGDNAAIIAEDKEIIDSQVNSTLTWLIEQYDVAKSDGILINTTQTCHRETLEVSSSPDKKHFIAILQVSPPELIEERVIIYTLAPHPSVQIHWQEIGSWSSASGLEIDGYLYPDVHRGFNNRTFLITTVNYPPFMIRHSNGTYDGICFDLLSELQAVMNFSYKVIEPDSQDYGTRLPDGNFTGMMKLIQKKKVDFAVAIFGINAERKAVADFTTPFMADPTIILMKKPDLATSQVFICLGPFNYQVWFLIGLSVIVVGMFLWVIVWIHPLHTPRTVKQITPHGIYDPKINVWQIFGALMQQGMVCIPESHSARIMISAWWFYTIVVVGTYNGNLIAFLTAPKVNTPVNSLAELADSGMKFGFARGTMLHSVFKTANEGVFKDLWDTIKNNKDEYIVDENSAGMELALHNPGYAFLLEKSFYDTLPNKDLPFRNESCRYARAKESFLNMYYGFPFQKGSPYVKEFDKTIMRILEAGLLEKWRRKWYAAVHRCTGLERTKEQSNISLAEAQGAFYILGIGLMVATLVLFSEEIWTRIKSKRRRATHNDLNGVISNGTANGSVYHVGSLPPVVTIVNNPRTAKTEREETNTREKSRTEEIEMQYARVEFSPYPVIQERKLVKRSRSFPLMFASCCRGEDSVNSEPSAWEMTETNGSLANGINTNGEIKSHNTDDTKTVSLLFNYSPAVAWYARTGSKWDSNLSSSTGTLRRRWHSDTGSYLQDGRFVKDAETGEYQKKKLKRS